MRLFKLLFISIILFFLLATAISLLFPSDIRISKAINLAATPEKIIGHIDDIGQWKDWYPGLDSSGFFYESGVVTGFLNKDGSRQHISFIQNRNDEVVAEIRSGKKKLISGWKTISYPQTDSTTLQWYIDFKLGWYPWNKFRSLLLEPTYGPQMEQGLNNIKKLVEADRASFN
ncbi:MAG: SRPBCC family protein [Chitinophagaceae bacterium]